MSEILFLFTMMIVILVSIKFAGLILGHGIDLPTLIPTIGEFSLSPDTAPVLYPSIMYQISFWAPKLGVVL